MPIKKSLLESKWYYRVAKTLLLLLPLFIGLYGYGMGYFGAERFWLMLAEHNTTLGEVIGALIVYYVGIAIIWKIICYVVFGGVENDLKPKQVAQPVAPPATQGTNQADEAVAKYVGEQQKHSGEVILWIIFILCIVAIAMYGNSNSSYVPGAPNPSPKCVSTGCGSLWRCSGAYYDGNGTRRSINGCYNSSTQVTTLSSWSGTCRRCP